MTLHKGAGEMQNAVITAATTTGFSGAVRVSRGGELLVDAALGLADRRHAIEASPTTRFGIASGTKGFTALVVLALIDRGVLGREAAARSILGDDLPKIDDRVTVEHLLTHSSGIGDYFPEEDGADINDHALAVPVHRLDSVEAYLEVIDGHPQTSAPGERFVYNNGGYCVLALIAERAAARSFADLVDELVSRPAGLRATGFERSDELPSDAAVGYLADPPDDRTNVFHLPVLGSGDGGLYSTVGDLERLWHALADGRLVSPDLRTWALSPQADDGYGAGFWLPKGTGRWMLEGFDAGVSFGSWCDPASDTIVTVVSNTSSGAWPVLQAIDDLLGPGGPQ